MVTIVHKVSGGSRLYSCARRHNIRRDFVETVEEIIASRGNYAMLLQNPVDYQLRARVPLDKPGEGCILPGMVKAIGKAAQVVDDIAHQIVVRALSALESGDLCFQKVEKSSEIDVLGMPYGSTTN
jgi:hypothetical protein